MKPFLITLILVAGMHRAFAQSDTLAIVRPYAMGWYDTMSDSALKTAFQRRSGTPEGGMSLTEGWQWGLGDESEGLEAKQVPTKLSATTDLPHRILQPNRSIWYKRVVSFGRSGRLVVQADDGAQIFVDGVAIKRESGNVFPVPALQRAVLVVRVLNNAMAGGLRQVRWLNEMDWEQWKIKEQTKQRGAMLARKQILIGLPEAKALVETAIGQPTQAHLEAAEALYKNYPLLIGPWITAGDQSRAWISAWGEPTHPVDLFVGPDSLHLTLEGRQRGAIVHFDIHRWMDRPFYYRLVSGKVKTPVYFVPPGNDAPRQFNVWADSQSGWKVFAKHLRGSAWAHDAFTVGVGDLVGNGADANEWMHFAGVLSSYAASRPAYLIPGNHDYDGYADDLRPVLFQQLVPRRPANYFSWYRGNCAFVALDPNAEFPIAVPQQSEQWKWLQAEVQSPAWKNATWRFVFVHQTLYSQGWAGYEGDQALRDLLEPLLEQARIDFVVSGHTHDYERLTRQYGAQKVTFFVVGGAGGELEPAASSATPAMDRLEKVYHVARVHVTENAIAWQVVDLQGNTIDQLSFSK
jgi:hypothetical protein